MYLWEFEQESGRLPADWEVERDLGFSPEEVNRIKISVLPSVSLDLPLSVAEEDELTMGDTVAPFAGGDGRTCAACSGE